MSFKILYIEDNPQNMRLVRKMLLSAGYDMIEAYNGETGFQIAMEIVPDLILMDINLPDVDGLTVTGRIKAHRELTHIPVIALTANAMHGDRERFIDSGCDGYIAKPITRTELLNLVEHYIAARSG